MNNSDNCRFDLPFARIGNEFRSTRFREPISLHFIVIRDPRLDLTLLHSISAFHDSTCTIQALEQDVLSMQPEMLGCDGNRWADLASHDQRSST